MPIASMKELKEREELKDKMTGDHHAGDGDVPKEALEMPVDGGACRRTSTAFITRSRSARSAPSTR